MDKSSISARGGRSSLSKIDEDSVWEKSLNSTPTSESEEWSGEPEETPEKAKQKIKSLEEVVENVQLDYDTLKEYTVLERQIYKTETLADLSLVSQPDILASSFVNGSCNMDRSRRSFVEEADSREFKLSKSIACDSLEDLSPCPEELQTTISNLKSENEKLKIALDEKEKRLEVLLNEESHCTESPAVTALQQQIEELTQQNREYKERITSLMQLQDEQSDKSGEKIELLNQIQRLEECNQRLKDDNFRLQQEADSHHQSQDPSQEDNAQLQRLLEHQKNLQNQRDTLQNAQASLQAQIDALLPCKQQLAEQNSKLQSLKEEFQIPESSDILSALHEYVGALNYKYDQAQLQLNSPSEAESSNDSALLLKNQVEDLTQQLEDAKKLAATETTTPEILTDRSVESNIFSEAASLESLLAEIKSYNCEIEGLKSSVRELEILLENKDKTIRILEAEVTKKDDIIAQLDCKTNILHSYMSFLTKHVEKVTNNNNILCLHVEEKSREINRLQNHVSGIKNKLKKLMDQEEAQKQFDLDASSLFYNLFEINAEGDAVVDTATDKAPMLPTILSNENPNESVVDALATSKSFIDFSRCLNNLFATDSPKRSQRNMNLDWFNETASYFHQLFESCSLDDSLADKSFKDKSLADASNYFYNLFQVQDSTFDKTVNASITHHETLDTSSYWYNLFDSFKSNGTVINESQNNGTNFESPNMLHSSFKSQNNSLNKSNNTPKTSLRSVLNGTNDLSLLYRSQTNQMDVSMNTSNILNFSKNLNDSQFCLSESMENRLLSSRNSAPNKSLKVQNYVNLDESNAIQPEIALCDGTMNSSTVFNNDYTCVDDPLKSFCADSTLIDQGFDSSGFMNDSLPTQESEYDLFLSPQSLLRKIVNLKILLNQFEKGVEELSGRRVDATMSTDPFVSAFNVLMKSYVSAYNVLKTMVKSFDLNDLVLNGFEISLRESSDPINLTLNYAAVDKKLQDLSVDLNDMTVLITSLEDQIDVETVASKSLEDTIHQKEMELEDLRNSTMKSEVPEMPTYQDHAEDPDEIALLEIEVVDLKNDLEAKENKIKELSCILEELKLKDETIAKVQSRFHDLQTRNDLRENIFLSFMEELKDFEKKGALRRDKITSLVSELDFAEVVMKTKSHEFEEIQERFLRIETHSVDPAATDSNASSFLSDIRNLLISLLDGKACAEEGLLDLLNEIGVLKAAMESEEKTLKVELQEKEAKIKELMEKNLEEMQKKTQDLDNQLKVKEESIQNLLDQVGDFDEDKDYFQGEMINLMKKVDALTSDLEDKDAEMSFMRADWQMTLIEMKEALKQNVLEVIIAEKVYQETRISDLVTQTNTLQSEKERFELRSQMLDETQAKLGEIAALLKKEETLSADLDTQVKKLKEDLEKCQNELRQALEEVERLNSVVELKNTELANLQSEAQNSELVKQELSGLSEENSSCKQQIADLVEKLQVLTTNETQSEQRIEGLVKELDHLKESEERSKVQIADLQKELDDLKENEAQSDFEFSDIVQDLTELKAADAQNKQRIADLINELESLKKENDGKDRRISDLLIEIEDLKEYKVQTEKKVEDLIEQMTVAMANDDQAKQDLQGFFEEVNVLRSNEAESGPKVSDLSHVLEILKADEVSLRQIEEVQAQVNEKESKAVELESKLRTIEMDKEQLEDKLNQAEEEMEKLKEESNNFVAQLEEERTAKERHIEELRTHICQLEKEQSVAKDNAVEELCSKLSAVEKELQDKQTALDDVQNKFEACVEEKACLELKMKVLIDESKTLASVKEDLAKLTDDTAAKDKRIEELVGELRNFEVEKTENVNLKEVVEQAELKLAKTELELKEKQQLVSGLEEDKNYLEEQMLALIQEVGTLKEQLESFENINIPTPESEEMVNDASVSAQFVDKEVKMGQSSSEARQEELVLLKEKLNQLDNEKKGKESEVSTLLQKLDDYQAKVESQLNEIDRLSKLTRDLERQVQEVRTTTEPLGSTRKEVPTPEVQDTEIDRLLKEISLQSEAHAKLKLESALMVEEKSDVIKTLEIRIAEKNDELSTILLEAESSQEEVTKLTAELSGLKESVTERDETIAKLKEQATELEALIRVKSADIESLMSELVRKSEVEAPTDLKTEVEGLTKKLATSEAECLAKSEEVSKLSGDVEQKSAQVSALEKQLFETQEKLSELESAEALVEKLKIEVKTNEETIVVFQTKIDNFEEEIRLKKAEGEEWTRKFAMLHEDIDSKVVEIENLKEQVSKLSETKEVKSLETKLHQLQSANNSDDLKESVAAKEQLIKEIKSLKPEFQADKVLLTGLVRELMTTILEKQQEIFSQLSNESETLKKENKYLKSKDNDSKKWLNDLEVENTKLQTSVKEKEEEISAASEKLSSLTNKLENNSDLVKSLQSQLELRENEVAELTSQVTELKNSTASQQTAEELKFQNEEINKLNLECEALRSKLQKEEETTASLKKMVDEELVKISELNNELASLKQELAESQQANASLKSAVVCKDDEISTLKEKLEQNVSSIGEFNELRNKYNEVVRLKDDLSNDVTKLRRAVDEKTEQIKTLECQLNQSVETVSGLKKQVEEKSAQITSLTQTVEEKTSAVEKLLVEKEQIKSDVPVGTNNSEMENIISSLNVEIKKLKDTVNKNMLEREVFVSESNKLKQQVKSLSEEIKLLESKLQIEKNRATIQVSEVRVLEEEKKRLAESLRQLEAEKLSLTERLGKLETSLDNSVSTPSSDSKKGHDSISTPPMFKRSQQYEKLNRKNAALEKKVESLMEKEGKLAEIEDSLRALLPPTLSPNALSALVPLLKRRITETEESLALMSKELTEKDCECQRLKLHLEKKVADLTAALNESEEKRKTLDEECVMTWQQCVSLEKDYAEALRRETELKRKLHESTLVSESMLAEGDVAKLKEEKNLLAQENSELTSQLRNLKNEKRQMVSDFYKAKGKAKEAESELNQLKGQIEALEKEKQILDAKNESLKMNLAQVTDEKESLSANFNVLLCKYDRMETSKNATTDDQLASLKSQTQKLKTEVAEKSAKITMLELQIQSENFPYRGKVAELENCVTSYKKKCEDLRSQLRRYQASVQESTMQECAQCFSLRSKAKFEVGVQTTAALHLDGNPSSIVQANAEAVLKDRVKKLEREHETMKRLCRMRASKISQLENCITQHNLPLPDSKENLESAPTRPAAKVVEKEHSFSSRLWPF